jgi:hypothetical protein
MALTDAQILQNTALALIGEYEITESDTESKQYVLCERFYEKARDEVLVSHLWNEAIIDSMVLESDDSPIFGYTYKYAKPEDCLRVISIGTEEYSWEVKGNYILTDFYSAPKDWVAGETFVAGQYCTLSDITYYCNISNTAETANSPATDVFTWTSAEGDYGVINLTYVKRLTTVSEFSPRLYQAISYKLAIMVVTSITGNMNNKVQLLNEYENLVMPQARGVDAAQGRPKKIMNTNNWIRARGLS